MEEVRFVAEIYLILKIAVKVAVGKEEESSLESLLFVEVLVKCEILVYLSFLHLTRL